ncbi:MAG: Gfo/Idh/MocA family oxidoreductase, partial [Frankiaceae bacterium]|nr:Gfo/Idh/MocA family oxidoreductase [Frankiaceae bacterium]
RHEEVVLPFLRAGVPVLVEKPMARSLDEADRMIDAAAGAGVALAVGRLADLATTRPAVAPGSRRGLLGVVAGIAAAVGVGAAYGSGASELGSGVGLRLAVIAAVLAVIADIAVDAVLAQAPPPDERRLSALTPLGVLLPVVLAGPVAYVAGRILLG